MTFHTSSDSINSQFNKQTILLIAFFQLSEESVRMDNKTKSKPSAPSFHASEVVKPLIRLNAQFYACWMIQLLE